MSMRWIKRQLRVYLQPALMIVVVFELSWLLILNFADKLGSSVNILQIVLENSLVGIVTFSAIFISFQIERNQKKEDERRILAFMMGSISGELRENLSLLKNAKENFKFDAVLSITSFNKMARVVLNKYLVISSLIKSIKNETFLSAQSSSAITTVDSDETYNKICQSYENLSILKTTNTVCEGNLNMAVFVSGVDGEVLTPLEQSMLFSSLTNLLTKVLKEIEFSEKMVCVAIGELENKLNSIGIKLTLEKRGVEQVGEPEETVPGI